MTNTFATPERGRASSEGCHMAKKSSRPQAADAAPAQRPRRPRAASGQASRELGSETASGLRQPSDVDARYARPHEAGPAADAPIETVSLSSSPSDEDIRRRAYQLYLERGGHHGLDFDDWMRAEDELRNRSK